MLQTEAYLIKEQRTSKNVSNGLNTNIYSYLETSGGQSYNLYLNFVHFLTPVLIRYNEGKSAASFCHQVAAWFPDMFWNFQVLKNPKIPKNSTTTKAKEKIRTDLETL